MKFKNIFKFFKEFGFSFTVKLCFNKFMFKCFKRKNNQEKVFKLILNYLAKYSEVMIDDCKNLKNIGSYNYKIWVFWWQGIDDSTPFIVKKCIDSIKRNFLDHEVVFVNKDNYKNYVEIPEYIIDKVNKGIITITHFSDIMRACLLSKHGGVWLDATCYLTDSIEKDIEKYCFYSNKLHNDGTYDNAVDKAKWSAFFLASCPDNPILLNLRNILFEYWKTHLNLINYFLVDYCIELSYEKFDNLKQIIDEVPFNNPHLHDLEPLLLKEFNKEEFENMKKGTKLFKLTYKIDFNKTTENSYCYRLK